VVPDRFQAPEDHITVHPADIQVEWLEPVEARGGVRLVHSPTGIIVEARTYSTLADNYRAALQALALQLVDRERSGSAR
jgi:protein subunit release factor A